MTRRMLQVKTRKMRLIKRKSVVRKSRMTSCDEGRVEGMEEEQELVDEGLVVGG